VFQCCYIVDTFPVSNVPAVYLFCDHKFILCR